jgi:hypothetical protein
MLFWLAGASLVCFVGSLIAIPFILVRLPADYLDTCVPRNLMKHHHPLGNTVVDPIDDSPRLDEADLLSLDMPIIEVGHRHDEFPRLVNRRFFDHRGAFQSTHCSHEIQVVDGIEISFEQLRADTSAAAHSLPF